MWVYICWAFGPSIGIGPISSYQVIPKLRFMLYLSSIRTNYWSFHRVDGGVYVGIWVWRWT
ncbi:hypothetical protein HanPSC8_Chr17g0797541 [Helianthus annuus]|nr:hypothetical protein HanPSC8_Chr17g0797541 [Helianthus annuus]